MNDTPYPNTHMLSTSGWLDTEWKGQNKVQKMFCALEDSNLKIFLNSSATKCELLFKITRDTKISKTNDQDSVMLENENDWIRLSSDDYSTFHKWYSILKRIAFATSEMSMRDFQIIKVIGRGLFGKVMLVKHIKSSELYAIKSIRKKLLMQSGRPQSVVAERNIMMLIKHPFIIQLHFAFQTPAKFYLGLEYAPGGELFNHIQKHGPVKLENARIYTAEIALALNHLHKIGVVYRDLKPENILFDSDGHVKLTDFGLAKDIYAQGTTKTFCGTNNYLAPEVILQQPYSYEIDWWALGILLCELLSGTEPFPDTNRSDLFHSIVFSPPQIPRSLPIEAKRLILSLLTKDPSKRPGFEEISRHPFFSCIDWQELNNKQYHPTFIPQIINYGLPNFEPEFTDEVPIDSPESISSDVMNIDGFSFNSPNGYNSESISSVTISHDQESI